MPIICSPSSSYRSIASSSSSSQSSSIPVLPIYLRPVLKAGVLALGYEYRDRAGQEIKQQMYEKLLAEAISRNGTIIKTSGRVRDIQGDSNGYAL